MPVCAGITLWECVYCAAQRSAVLLLCTGLTLDEQRLAPPQPQPPAHCSPPICAGNWNLWRYPADRDGVDGVLQCVQVASANRRTAVCWWLWVGVGGEQELVIPFTSCCRFPPPLTPPPSVPPFTAFYVPLIHILLFRRKDTCRYRWYAVHEQKTRTNNVEENE